MIRPTPAAAGDTLHCGCCGKTFTATNTMRIIEVTILDKLPVRAEVCANCHRKSQSKRGLNEVGRRVVERYDHEVAALLLPLALVASNRGAV